MNRETRGQVRPIDTLILLAVTAVGLAGMWYVLKTPVMHVKIQGFTKMAWPIARPYPESVGRVSAAVGVLLAAWSLGLTLVGWRRGRPSPSPGLSACLAAVVVSALFLTVHLVVTAFRGWPYHAFSASWGGGGIDYYKDAVQIDAFAFVILPEMIRFAAPAAVGALLVTIVAIRRRPRGWVEWTALLVGMGWMVVWVVLGRYSYSPIVFDGQ
jgi:hypothetical protein